MKGNWGERKIKQKVDKYPDSKTFNQNDTLSLKGIYQYTSKDKEIKSQHNRPSLIHIPIFSNNSSYLKRLMIIVCSEIEKTTTTYQNFMNNLKIYEQLKIRLIEKQTSEKL